MWSMKMIARRPGLNLSSLLPLNISIAWENIPLIQILILATMDYGH